MNHERQTGNMNSDSRKRQYAKRPLGQSLDHNQLLPQPRVGNHWALVIGYSDSENGQISVPIICPKFKFLADETKMDARETAVEKHMRRCGHCQKSENPTLKEINCGDDYSLNGATIMHKALDGFHQNVVAVIARTWGSPDPSNDQIGQIDKWMKKVKIKK